MANDHPLYRIKDLRFNYTLGTQKVEALRGITLDLPGQGITCLTGPSGSGKTTLLNILGLIEPVQSGQAILKGQDLKDLSEVEKNTLRRFKIGFIFQTFQLFPVLTAEENVEYFLTRQGVEASLRQKRVREALESVGLWEHRMKKPLQMSGGQRQRVAIARAIAKSPEVIIADEPTASLDQKTGRELMEIFKDMSRHKKVEIVISSHDPMVLTYADSQVKLQDGLIC
jgi:putative ABC transport system ATP-binding protein